MARRKACPHMYPLSPECQLGCLCWAGHKGMHETVFPDQLGRDHQIYWDSAYPAIAARVTREMSADLETRRVRA